jgi:preprotein translocase subunit YajC
MLGLIDSFVLAMASPGQGNFLFQILPVAVVVAIFYFLILLPMKRKQQKIQEFQDNLKVGDKIVTTGGIYGKITRVTDKTLQVEVAERVRIELSRAAVAGYQGQEPVVADSGNS